jgi:alkylated DNA repair dioxygenase AlkB
LRDLFCLNGSPSQFIEISPEVDFEFAPNERIRGFDLRLDGGDISFSEEFFSEKLSNRMVAYLQENSRYDWRTTDWSKLSEQDLKEIEFRNLKWKQDHIRLFGKVVPLPRLTSWYGDPGASYSYSGINSTPNPWNAGLLHLKKLIEDATGSSFNSVLLNWYRDGSDSLSWHADDEKELGAEPIIASANFGASRDFMLRRKDNKRKLISIRLQHGSFLVMRGKTQENWEHSVPKRKSTRSSRFNLTFRRIAVERS